MRAKFIYEKFVEDSDPVEDLGIGTRKKISKWMEELGEKDTDGNALAECAEHGKTEWVKFLIARGADIHYLDDDPLGMAAFNGHTEIVKILLDAGSDIHVQNNFPVRFAANNGHTETVKVLIARGADVHANNNWALRQAAYNGHAEVVKVLEDHIAKEKKAKRAKKIKESLNEKFVEDSDPVEDLGLGTRKKISRWMEEKKFSESHIADIDFSLAACAEFGKIEWVKYLLANGADVHYMTDWPLRLACWHNRPEMVKVLIDAGADVNTDNIRTFRGAIRNKNIEIIKMLINAGSLITYEVFKQAIETGNEEIIKLFLNKCPLNKKTNARFKSHVIWVLDHGLFNVSVLKILRDHLSKNKSKKIKENLNEKFVEDSDPVEDLIGTRKQISKFMRKLGKENFDDYALAICAEYGKTEWVKFLLARGANMDFAHFNCFRMACENGHAEIVKILLNAGADVNYILDFPIRIASENNHTETVKVLIDAGADVNTINSFPLVMAVSNRNLELIKILLDAGAKVTEEIYRITKNENNPDIYKIIEKSYIKESLNEKFVEDSDPVEDLISSFKKKRTVKTQKQAAEYIIRVLPQILDQPKIPEDIINISHYYIKSFYWELIDEYLKNYITITNDPYSRLPVNIYNLLYQMGFKDDYHDEKI